MTSLEKPSIDVPPGWQEAKSRASLGSRAFGFGPASYNPGVPGQCPAYAERLLPAIRHQHLTDADGFLSDDEVGRQL
jgi:hypothetical protein